MPQGNDNDMTIDVAWMVLRRIDSTDELRNDATAVMQAEMERLRASALAAVEGEAMIREHSQALDVAYESLKESVLSAPRLTEELLAELVRDRWREWHANASGDEPMSSFVDHLPGALSSDLGFTIYSSAGLNPNVVCSMCGQHVEMSATWDEHQCAACRMKGIAQRLWATLHLASHGVENPNRIREVCNAFEQDVMPPEQLREAQEGVCESVRSVARAWGELGERFRRGGVQVVESFRRIGLAFQRLNESFADRSSVIAMRQLLDGVESDSFSVPLNETEVDTAANESLRPEVSISLVDAASEDLQRIAETLGCDTPQEQITIDPNLVLGPRPDPVQGVSIDFSFAEPFHFPWAHHGDIPAIEEAMAYYRGWRDTENSRSMINARVEREVRDRASNGVAATTLTDPPEHAQCRAEAPPGLSLSPVPRGLRVTLGNDDPINIEWATPADEARIRESLEPFIGAVNDTRTREQIVNTLSRLGRDNPALAAIGMPPALAGCHITAHEAQEREALRRTNLERIGEPAPFGVRNATSAEDIAEGRMRLDAGMDLHAVERMITQEVHEAIARETDAMFAGGIPDAVIDGESPGGATGSLVLRDQRNDPVAFIESHEQFIDVFGRPDEPMHQLCGAEFSPSPLTGMRLTVHNGHSRAVLIEIPWARPEDEEALRAAVADFIITPPLNRTFAATVHARFNALRAVMGRTQHLEPPPTDVTVEQSVREVQTIGGPPLVVMGARTLTREYTPVSAEQMAQRMRDAVARATPALVDPSGAVATPRELSVRVHDAPQDHLQRAPSGFQSAWHAPAGINRGRVTIPAHIQIPEVSGNDSPEWTLRRFLILEEANLIRNPRLLEGASTPLLMGDEAQDLIAGELLDCTFDHGEPAGTEDFDRIQNRVLLEARREACVTPGAVFGIVSNYARVAATMLPPASRADRAVENIAQFGLMNYYLWSTCKDVALGCLRDAAVEVEIGNLDEMCVQAWTTEKYQDEMRRRFPGPYEWPGLHVERITPPPQEDAFLFGPNVWSLRVRFANTTSHQEGPYIPGPREFMEYVTRRGTFESRLGAPGLIFGDAIRVDRDAASAARAEMAHHVTDDGPPTVEEPQAEPNDNDGSDGPPQLTDEERATPPPTAESDQVRRVGYAENVPDTIRRYRLGDDTNEFRRLIMQLRAIAVQMRGRRLTDETTHMATLALMQEAIEASAHTAGYQHTPRLTTTLGVINGVACFSFEIRDQSGRVIMDPVRFLEFTRPTRTHAGNDSTPAFTSGLPAPGSAR